MNVVEVRLGRRSLRVPPIAVDVTISRVQARIIGFVKVHLKVREQVVARHEVVRVRQAVRFGVASPQMALAADGNDLQRLARVLGWFCGATPWQT